MGSYPHRVLPALLFGTDVSEAQCLVKRNASVSFQRNEASGLNHECAAAHKNFLKSIGRRIGLRLVPKRNVMLFAPGERGLRIGNWDGLVATFSGNGLNQHGGLIRPF
jgi:hypothetical protein